MNEIIEMARQAGAAVGKPTPDGPNIVFTQSLDIYAFAKLVAEAEREACAKECDNADYLGIAAHHCANAIRARTKA